MHIPDGFLSPAVWATLDVAAIPAVAWAARQAQTDLEETQSWSLALAGDLTSDRSKVTGAFRSWASWERSSSPRR